MTQRERAIEVAAADGGSSHGLATHLEAVVAHLTTPLGDHTRLARASIRIVGDEEMARMHATHSGVEGTTDVLTFVFAAPPEPIETDIAICRDEAARQAGERGITIDRELLLYAVHGLLHAAGFGDATDADAARMHEEEDRLLTAIGVGAVYAPRPRIP